MKPVIPGTSLALHPERFPDPADDLPASGMASAVLAGGCFWCVEAVYLNLDGVQAVVSGYAGGDAGHANYEAVCTGTTGHAEVVKISFDSNVISYGQLLKVFFSVAHDPTQKDRQGNDRGPQYRSAIFYQNDQEKQVAESYIQQLDRAGAFTAPIVTTLEPLTAFFPAEDYHQDFARRNPAQPYIAHVARPKVDKLKQAFPEKLKG
ncbi:methionine sulfoxide peptide reductase [Alcanivorax hongdengensis A-11-3]|uniref:Peptide methionine sulfoxide reductase MsrA n=1 Tax=Alcanivorax hongdengensis A-11-3 TaxID=1177179 RepID=L0WGS5_9GAMM|nr:peptide-methionine (S)-S-oxide reductase MsrA [Alcanivorax hongdengensis]EKF75025.1 methionine sulfoxide peptide reductase [Alcanivorax hongdengensis A-11-3]